MKEYRFTLDSSSAKYFCPCCGKKTFVRYIDTDTKTFLPEQYGRCDREANCSYHLNPYKDGYHKGNYATMKTSPYKRLDISQYKKEPLKRRENAFFSKSELQKTLKGYESNLFIQNLLSNIAFPFKKSDVSKVISQYYIGSANYGEFY